MAYYNKNGHVVVDLKTL